MVSGTNPSVSGQSVTFTATVSISSPGSNAVANPSGTVTFYDGGTSIGSGTLSGTATDTASFSTSTLPTGSDSITAAYTSGDSNFNASGMSSAISQVVNKASTTTAGSVTGTQYFGQTLTLTAMVSANAPSTATPTGSVDFKDSTANDDLGTIPLSGGKATLSTPALPLSKQTITLSFLGNSSFVASNTTVSVTIVASVFALNSTASGALALVGTSSITVPGTVLVDSSSRTALTASGSARVTAGSILVVGGVSTTGSATLSPAPTTGVAAVLDPLASLPAPSPSGLTNYGAASYSSGTHTLKPGIYTAITASGTASLTLNAGVYILEGGGLTVSVGAVVSGSGVMLYNTSSKYPTSGGSFGSISVSGTLNLTAATTGPYAGVVIFQNRGNTQPMTLSGSAFVQGPGNIVYVPAALLSLSGSADIQGALVVGTLSLSGNSDPSSGSPALPPAAELSVPVLEQGNKPEHGVQAASLPAPASGVLPGLLANGSTSNAPLPGATAGRGSSGLAPAALVEAGGPAPGNPPVPVPPLRSDSPYLASGSAAPGWPGEGQAQEEELGEGLLLVSSPAPVSSRAFQATVTVPAWQGQPMAASWRQACEACFMEADGLSVPPTEGQPLALAAPEVGDAAAALAALALFLGGSWGRQGRPAAAAAGCAVRVYSRR